ncbi:MAG: hypothetical protein HRU32_11735 [Rhodobacteraceae bacterium]|nr:hypothetical protein [Paracoccaceae bacterium]
MNATPGYRALLALTAVVYGVLLFWSFPTIEAAAGGLTPLDLRAFGYDEAAAHAFLTALTDEGRAFYAGVHGALDAVAPGLLFATVGIALWALSEGWQRATRIMLVVVAAIAMGADMFENMRIRDLLVLGPDRITAELVATASLMTVIKSAALLVSFAALVGLLAAHLVRERG